MQVWSAFWAWLKEISYPPTLQGQYRRSAGRRKRVLQVQFREWRRRRHGERGEPRSLQEMVRGAKRRGIKVSPHYCAADYCFIFSLNHNVSAFLQPRIHYEVLEGVQHATMVTGEKARDKVLDIVKSINGGAMVWAMRGGKWVNMVNMPAWFLWFLFCLGISWKNENRRRSNFFGIYTRWCKAFFPIGFVLDLSVNLYERLSTSWLI